MERRTWDCEQLRVVESGGVTRGALGADKLTGCRCATAAMTLPSFAPFVVSLNFPLYQRKITPHFSEPHLLRLRPHHPLLRAPLRPDLTVRVVLASLSQSVFPPIILRM